MNLQKLIRGLLENRNTADIVSTLSCIQMSDIEEKTSRRVPILKKCLTFLLSAAENRNYSHIPPMLKFVRMANSLDQWLISSSSIILPNLHPLYCKILSTADPGKLESPQTVNVVISPRVKQDKEVLRALCSVFEVCFGFCDLVDEENERQLGRFLRSSAAVLFGSDFLKKRDTLNETDYAMDELARYSSYAFSNIMLAYPAVIPMAESLLGKRLRDLFKFLLSSPELSINRSLILMLRSLYQRYETNQGDSHKYRSLMDNVFSCSRSGRQSVLDLFQKINLVSENASTEAENISLRMYSADKDDVCFKTIKCSVQVKEVSGNSRGRVLFQSASVDWNRNSFVIHRAGQSPEYWPLFSVSNLNWKKSKRELHLQLAGPSQKKKYRIVIRFLSDSVSAPKKDIIEDRLLRIMEQVKLQSERDADERIDTVRKASFARMNVVHFPVDVEPDTNDWYNEENTEHGPKSSTRATQKHIFSETPPHKIYADDYRVEENSAAACQTSQADSRKEDEQNSEAGSMKTETNSHKSGCSSSDCEGGEGMRKRDATDTVGSQHLATGEQSAENGSSSGDFDDGNPSKRVTLFSSREEHEAECDAEEKSPDQRSEPFLFGVTNSHGNEFDKNKRNDCANRTSRDHFDRPKPDQNMCAAKTVQVMEMKEPEAGFANKEVLNVLTAEDEHLRQKLQTVIKTILQWKQGQASQLLRDTKISIKSMKETRRRQDQELLVKFVNGVRTHSSLHTEKLAVMTTHTKGVLQKTRKRLRSLKEKLLEGREKLKIMKTQSSTDIGHARELMRKERHELEVRLDQCVASTSRRSESRAKKNSMLQTLTRLLKEG